MADRLQVQESDKADNEGLEAIMRENKALLGAIGGVQAERDQYREALEALEAETRNFFAGGDYSGMYRATRRAREALDG